jgi:hypothetical protein
LALEQRLNKLSHAFFIFCRFNFILRVICLLLCLWSRFDGNVFFLCFRLT